METIDQKPELTFYSERNSVDVQYDVNQLFEDPEVQLTPEQDREVYNFTKAVYEGEIGGIKRESPKNMEELQSMSPGACIQEFYLGYFLTPQGREDLIKMGVKAESEDEIAAGLGDIDKIQSNVDDKTRIKIAKNSLDWYKNQIVESLEVNRDLDEAQLDHNSARVNYDPTKLLDKIEALAAHRKFYRQVKAELKKQPDSLIKSAKELELELSIARANSMLAGLYESVLALGEQLLKRPTDGQAGEWLNRIQGLTPMLFRALTRSRNDTSQSLKEYEYSLARRTDYLLQGIAWTEDGKLSSISAETIEFATLVTRENEKQEAKIDPIFNNSTIEKLKTTKWNAQQFKEFCEDILKQWGILSQYEADWLEAVKRDSPAADNKWQVIIDPQADSIKVNRTKKLYRIPESFNRNLIKSLTVAAHELGHLAQAESDTVLAEKTPLAVAGGRRTSAMREGGAVDQEARAYAMLGIQRPTRVAYLSALQAKLSGANLVQVARAFYDSYDIESQLSEDERHENKVLAADRALRLYRNGGYNSQPLDYIEGELIKLTLSQISPDLVEPIMLSGASFSLRDSVRLHRLGRYNAPVSTEFHPANDVMRMFKEKYLQQILP